VGANPTGKTYATDYLSDWESWLVEYDDASLVTLKSAHGQWLSANKNGHTRTLGHCKLWERFALKRSGNGWAFRTFHETWLGANITSGIHHTNSWTESVVFILLPKVEVRLGFIVPKILEFPFIHDALVAFRCFFHPRYLAVHSKIEQGVITTHQCKDWETIRIERHGDKVALKSVHKTFIGVDSKGLVYACKKDRSSLTDNEKFTPVHFESRHWSLKSVHGTFLMADQLPSAKVISTGVLTDEAKWIVESLIEI